jgi:hypothetical protein
VARRGGEHVTLLGAAGQRCMAQIGQPYALYQAETWDIVSEPSRVDWAEAGDELVRQRSALLVSALEVLDGDCTDARIGFRADRPEPSAFITAEPASADRAGALAALRSLPAWQDIQTEYETFSWPEQRWAEGNWDGYDGAEPTVHFLQNEAGERRAVVQVQVGQGCGDFSGALWGVFATRDGVFHPRAWRRSYDVPDLLLEGLELPGQALVGPRWALLPTKTGYRSVHAEIPVFSCPC